MSIRNLKYQNPKAEKSNFCFCTKKVRSGLFVWFKSLLGLLQQHTTANRIHTSIDSTLTKDWQHAYQLIVTSRYGQPLSFFIAKDTLFYCRYTLSTVVLCIDAVACSDRPKVSRVSKYNHKKVPLVEVYFTCGVFTTKWYIFISKEILVTTYLMKWYTIYR